MFKYESNNVTFFQAAMDTQEGEGQQPPDPQPADPAVEEQGMEHWPWPLTSSFCDISLSKTQLYENSAITVSHIFLICKWLLQTLYIFTT